MMVLKNKRKKCNFQNTTKIKKIITFLIFVVCHFESLDQFNNFYSIHVSNTISNKKFY